LMSSHRWIFIARFLFLVLSGSCSARHSFQIRSAFGMMRS
jgi:hypothetical protein